MKKKAWIYIASLSALIVTVAVIALLLLKNTNDNISGIEIGQKPFKTSYYVGEELELRGLTVKAVYKNGEKETLDTEEYTVKKCNLNKAGEKTVVIKYNRHKAEFKVNVTKEPELTGLRLDTSNINSFFIKDTKFTKKSSGLIVYEVLSDGSERISRKYKLSDVDTSSTGTKKVDVTCGDFKESYEIEVMYGLHFVPADPNSSEAEYICVDWESDTWVTGEPAQYHRSADGNKTNDDKNLGAYFTYYMDFGSTLSKLTLDAKVKFQTKIEVSFDDVHYQTIYMPIYSTQVERQRFDLVSLLDGQDGNLKFADNKGFLYFRFSDPTKEDGFGADLYDFNLYYDLVDSSLYKVPEGPFTNSHDLAFKIGTEEENKFLYAEEGTAISQSGDRGQHRFNNASDSYMIYGIDFRGKIKNLSTQITMQGQVKLEASIDGKNWSTLCDYKKYVPYANFTYSLAGLLPEFTDNNGKIYLRFTDSDNDGSMGADLFALSFKYSLIGENDRKEPIGIPNMDGVQQTDYRLEFAAHTEKEKKYLVDSASTGKMSDDEGTFRSTDGIGSYFTYGIDLGGKITDASLRLKIGQKFQKVEVSFDGQNWETVLSKKNNNGVAERKFDLSKNKGYANNTGKVFVRLSPSEGYDGSFGITLYNLCLDYNLAPGATYKEPIVATGVETSKTKHTLSFDTCTTTEEKFLIENNGTGEMSDDEGVFRFIDGKGSYFTYGIDVGSQMEVANVYVKAGQKYQKIEISFDGTSWQTVLNKENNTGVNKYTYDLSKVAGFSKNTGELYVKFSGGDGYKGEFGITAYEFSLNYDLAKEDLYIKPTAITDSNSYKHSLSFNAFTYTEEKYILEEVGTAEMKDNSGYFRFIDGKNSYFTYGIDAGSKLQNANVTMKIGQKYRRVDISFDGTNWTTVLNTNINDGAKVYKYELKDIKGFENNTGKVYVKFLGGEGYQGYFGTILYQFKFTYDLADETLYTTPTKIK